MKAIITYSIVFALLMGSSFSSLAVSTGHIVGQVTVKETGKPVALAKIVFENSFDKIEVEANEHGHYYASYIPTGKYQMRVSFNNRTFVMNHVRVYDSYSSEVDIALSNNEQLPEKVELERTEPIISSVAPTD